MNRQSGKTAQFEYFNERRIPAKKGLLEILGYITRIKEGKETRFRINHEAMPYYTVQTTLQEQEERQVSKEDLRVCSLYEETHSQINYEPNAEALEEEVSVGETEVSPRTERPQRNDKGGENREGGTEKKEEEVIDSTHTNQSSESESIPDMPKYASICLTPEEQAILTAKPTPKKCVDCGRIDAANPYRVLCPKGMGMRSRSDVCVYGGPNG
jgi:hypothetical protein